jgi:hypothetical protein
MQTVFELIVGLGTVTLAVLTLVASIIVAGIVVVILDQKDILGDTDDTDTDTDTDPVEHPQPEGSEQPLPSESEVDTDLPADVQSTVEADGVDYPVSDLDAHDEEVKVVSDISEVQMTELAPPQRSEDSENQRYIRTGPDTFIRSSFVSGWPEAMQDGQLQDVFAQSGIEADTAIHIDPIPTQDALADLKAKVEDIQADVRLLLEDGNEIEAEDRQRELRDYRGMRNTIRDSDAELFDVGFYYSIVGSSERDVEIDGKEFDDMLASNGLQTTLFTKAQEATHRSVTPTLTDDTGMQQSMMSAGIGAMMPFSSGTLISEDGIPLGEHGENGSPIIYDRFNHERGYSWLTIGNIGAGKSFSTKLHLLRRRLSDPDTILIMLDPLEGFAGLNSALNGRPITVGGDTGINPLEIKRVPDDVLDNNPELNPGRAKLKDLKSFFQSFFSLRGQELGELWDTLQRALKESYVRKGIDLNDPTTHDRENPTIQDDLVPVLLEMVTDEQEHSIIGEIVDSEQVEEVFEKANNITEEEQQRASELLLAMEAFLEGNALGNLGTHSDFEFGDEDVVWLDLQQQEGRGSLGLMMNLLFSAVYERAKQSDKNIIFAIDEARYIMKDKSALEFLEQAVRHSRHYDLSIQFITQTIDEFFQHDEAKAIADQCDHKLFFHTEGLTNDIAQKVGMNPVQASFARQATPGDEDTGYSEAVLGVSDYGWYPIHIYAMDEEAAVIDLDPQEGIEQALPGMSDNDRIPARVQQLRDRLLSKQMEQQTEPMIPEREIVIDDGENERVADPSQLVETSQIEQLVANEIVESDDATPTPIDIDMTADSDEIVANVASMDDVERLNRAYVAERDGANRDDVLETIAEQIADLQEPRAENGAG